MAENGDLDDVLEALGPSGRYQICQYIWLLLSFLTVVFGILGFLFIGKPVPHQCAPLSPQSFNDILASLGIPSGDVVSNSTVLNNCTIDVTIVTTTSTENTTVGCVDGQDFGSLLFTSVVSEFSLVCDRQLLSRLPMFFMLAAQALGGIVIPLVADKVGRRPLLLISHAAVAILTVSMAFPRSIVFFIVLKAISGLFVEGLLLTTVTMAVELTPVKDRKLVGLGVLLIWFMSGLVLVSISFGLRLEPWRILQYALAAASIVVFFQIYIIEESIRWFLAVGLTKKATAVITFVAKCNKVDESKVLLNLRLTDNTASSVTASDTTATGGTSKDDTSADKVIATDGTSADKVIATDDSSHDKVIATDDTSADKVIATDDTSADKVIPTDDSSADKVIPTEAMVSSSVDKAAVAPSADTTRTAVVVAPVEPGSVGCCQLASNKHLICNTFIFIYLWLVTGFSYYALYFTTTVFADDIYLNFTVNVLSELPSAFIIVFGVDSIGRKKVMFTFLAIGVIFLTITSVVTAFSDASLQSTLLPIFGLLGKLGVAGAYFTLILYTGETYPTSFRLIGLGIASVSGRIGALGSPFVVFLDDSLAWVPTALISILLLIGIFTIFPLPETKGKELPQTLDDIDRLYDKTDSS